MAITAFKYFYHEQSTAPCSHYNESVTHKLKMALKRSKFNFFLAMNLLFGGGICFIIVNLFSATILKFNGGVRKSRNVLYSPDFSPLPSCPVPTICSNTKKWKFDCNSDADCHQHETCCRDSNELKTCCRIKNTSTSIADLNRTTISATNSSTIVPVIYTESKPSSLAQELVPDNKIKDSNVVSVTFTYSVTKPTLSTQSLSQGDATNNSSDDNSIRNNNNINLTESNASNHTLIPILNDTNATSPGQEDERNETLSKHSVTIISPDANRTKHATNVNSNEITIHNNTSLSNGTESTDANSTSLVQQDERKEPLTKDSINKINSTEITIDNYTSFHNTSNVSSTSPREHNGNLTKGSFRTISPDADITRSISKINSTEGFGVNHTLRSNPVPDIHLTSV